MKTHQRQRQWKNFRKNLEEPRKKIIKKTKKSEHQKSKLEPVDVSNLKIK